jgi:hypothetical protein
LDLPSEKGRKEERKHCRLTDGQGVCHPIIQLNYRGEKKVRCSNEGQRKTIFTSQLPLSSNLERMQAYSYQTGNC